MANISGKKLLQAAGMDQVFSEEITASPLIVASQIEHVKVYDTATYQVVHTLDYPSAILTVACAPDDAALVVGMADGLVSIQHKKPEVKHTAAQVKKQQKKASYKYTLMDHVASKDDFVVEHKRREILAPYDRFFKKFEHSKALDAALNLKVRSKTPEVTVSVFQELIRRSAIRPALAARNEDSVISIIKFIQRNISNPRFMNTLIDISNILLDLYAEQVGQSHQISELLSRFKNTVQEELMYMRSLMGLLGTMETLFSVAESSSQSSSNNFVSGAKDSAAIAQNGHSSVMQPSANAASDGT